MQFYLGHSIKIPINRKTQEIAAVAECSLYQLTQMCPLKGFQRVPLPCLPAICQLFSPFPSSLISPLSLPFSFPLWDHVPVVAFYLFHCNLSLSPIKSNANPRSLPSCFSLAWPLFTLPSALVSIQPHTLHLICLVPLTLSSSHAYCSLALFLLHFCHDLAPLNST